MRHALSLGLLLASLLVACTKDTSELPATALIVRVSAASELQSSVRSVRLRTAGNNGQVWAVRSQKVFPAEALKWRRS